MSLPLRSADSHAVADAIQQANVSELAPTESTDVLPRPESDETLAGFFRGIAPQARRFAMSLTRRWCDAEELVQEACFRMTRTEHRPEANGVTKSRKAYLFRTIRNLAIDRQRAAQRQSIEPRPLDSIPQPSQRTPEQQRRNLERIESVVEAACRSMPDGWSDALKLKVDGQLSYAEIADVLAVSPAQVRGWIYRARKKLTAELQQHGLLETDS